MSTCKQEGDEAADGETSATTHAGSSPPKGGPKKRRKLPLLVAMSRWIKGCGQVFKPDKGKREDPDSAYPVRRDVEVRNVTRFKSSRGLREKSWREAFDSEGHLFALDRVLKKIQRGGIVSSCIRGEVWEFLLGCYATDSTAEERQRIRLQRREMYQKMKDFCASMDESVGSGEVSTSPPKTEEELAEERRIIAENVKKMIAEARSVNAASSSGTPSKAGDGVGEAGERAFCTRMRQVKPVVSDMSGGSDGGSDEEGDEDEDDDEADDDAVDIKIVDKGRGTVALLERSLPISKQSLEIEHNSESEADDDDDEVLAAVGGEEEKHAMRGESTPNGVVSNRGLGLLPACRNPTSAISNGSHKVDSGKEENKCAVGSSEEEIQGQVKTEKVKEPVDVVKDERVEKWRWMLHQIGLDVLRTDRYLQFYEDKRNLARLWDTLAVYAWVDPECGYCQGMSDLMSPLVVLFKDEADAFWCFERLMRRVRENFTGNSSSLGAQRKLEHIAAILSVVDAELHNHLASLGAGTYTFAVRVLMTMFRRELSFADSLYMWEIMWAMEYNFKVSDEIARTEISVPGLPDIPASCGKGGKATNSGQGPTLRRSDTEVRRQEFLVRRKKKNVHIWRQWGLGGDYEGLGKYEKARVKAGQPSGKRSRDGDDDLSLFCVAAVLHSNRERILRHVHGMDEIVEFFNEVSGKLVVRSVLKEALILYKDYKRHQRHHRKSSRSGLIPPLKKE
ncbi:hypothetical protein CBR_g16128 [Chara braunii]|uniref:Rab-GAP TBC domain-containing protein n=1 Tax=Chara braunii TaxID=69332 RepID=A0A388KTS6_CHABU|nr:hypothetical protein CBR_g16128 [Chara braunii]|eukprot:GBG73412.1 hypothetical protein CBR_g16128 [Chara braunii]